MSALLAAQDAHDRALLKGQPKLLARKHQRMSESPFAFLRGALPFFGAALKEDPSLLRGLEGQGRLVGDLHLENFGTWRTAGGQVVFDINDLDAAGQGPLGFDLLRLGTSLLLARGDLGVSGPEVLGLLDALLEGYRAGRGGSPRREPAAVAQLKKEARAQSQGKLIEKRVDDSGVRLKRDPEKTPEASVAWLKAVPAMVAEWADGLADPPGAAVLEVLDGVQRVMGTGSLGIPRLLVLLRGDGAGRWLLDVKAGSPAAAEAVKTWLPMPPARFGASKLGTLPVLVHPLAAGEDKLEAGKLEPEAAKQIVPWLGVLLGRLHRRGGAPAKVSWSEGVVRERVLRMARLHRDAFWEFSAR